MKRKAIQIRGIPRILVVGGMGAVLGAVLSGAFNPRPFFSADHLVPAPYRIPKIPGGTSLRMAMVHDILHERYLRHGSAWYAQRNSAARKIVAAKTDLTSLKSLDAMDDLAVGLEQLGQLDEAISVMRKKVQLLSPIPDPPRSASNPDDLDAENEDLPRILAAQNLTPLQHQQYSACANLGTILLLQAISKATAGDKVAIAQMGEALDWVERSLAINPGAHFGRERWQAIAIEDLLAATKHPALLADYDLFGDSLAQIEPDDRDHGFSLIYGRRPSDLPSDSQIDPDTRLHIRRFITRVGMDAHWQEIVHSDYDQPMPFDEPALGIIGMWTMGGGPNPHFALALGCMMEEVGQPSIAWEAYERAVELSDSFWPDAGVRQKMIDFCRSRQNRLAESESSSDPGAWQTKMRQRHGDELAWGLAYQKAYQDYEASQIAAGVPLDDPQFYAGFFKGRPPIASNPGQADDLIVNRSNALPLLALGLGLGMALALVIPERHLS